MAGYRGIELRFDFSRRIVRVFYDLDILNRYQTFIDHLIQHRQELIDALGLIDNLNNDGKIFGES